jgi:hypothetical protein
MKFDVILNASLPPPVFAVVKKINNYNKGKGLIIPQDKNSYSFAWKRLVARRHSRRHVMTELGIIMINILYTIVVTFQAVIFNYFGAILVLAL